MNNFQANWYRANNFCTSNGNRLARILSKEENNLVQKLIEESGNLAIEFIYMM